MSLTTQDSATDNRPSVAAAMVVCSSQVRGDSRNFAMVSQLDQALTLQLLHSAWTPRDEQQLVIFCYL